MSDLTWPVPALVMVIGAGIWLWLYFRYGREHVAEAAPEVLAEPPYDWTPVQLGLLWRYGRLQPADMIASFLDLVRRRALDLMAEPTSVLHAGGLAGIAQQYEFFVERVPRSRVSLTAAERYLVDEILFRYARGEHRTSLTYVMIEGAREHRETCARFDDWREIAEGEAPPLPLEDPLSKRMSRAGMAVGLVMLILAWPLAVLSPNALIVPLIVLGCLMLPGSKAIRKRTPEAAAALSRWQAFRRYLLQWSSLTDGPAHSVVLWEKYLTYGVTLGAARRVIDGFRLLYPSRENIAEARDMYESVFSPGADPFGRALAQLVRRHT